MVSLKLIFTLVLMLVPLRAQEGVEVTATVDRNQVGLGDVINLTVSVSAQDSVNVQDPQLPNISGIELLNTSTGVETRSSFTNGRFVSQQSRSFNYMLAVQKPGALVIPPLQVSVNGKVFPTKAITVNVSNQRSQAQRPQRPDPMGALDDEEELFNQILQRNFPGAGRGAQRPDAGPPVNPNEAFFIQAEVDKNKAYVGEQVTVAFYIYTRGQIRDIDTLKYPDLKGFWKEELEMATRLNFEQSVVNGIPYQRALLVSYALFPIKPGVAKVDPYKAKCTVLTPTSFGFGRPYQFTKSSREIPIEVMDVPVEGRPANFTGAVGRFRLSAQFEPPTGVTNQPTTLRVRFEGQGNAKLIELPKIDLPPSFELYDQKSQARFLKDGTSFKEFEVLVIPREPGTFDIPPLSVAVFDPESRKFTTVNSQALKIAVTGTASAPGAPAPAVTASAPKDNTPQLPALATDPGSHQMGEVGQVALTVLFFLGSFTFLGVFGWKRLRQKPKKASLRIVLNRRARKIRELTAAGEFRRVGVEVTNASYYILGQLSDRGGANLELSLLLEQTAPSLRNELAGSIQKLLTQAEALSFAPEGMIGDMTQKPKLEALNKEFERVMGRAIELAEV